MAFELVSQQINALVNRHYLHDVTIERHLYRHSRARVVIDWDESLLEGNKTGALHPTANLGAAMLDTDVTLRWRGRDLQSNVNCFHGYVAGVSARHEATRSYVVLDCVSYSQRTDVVPRFRVWQTCTLLDICQYVASKEPRFEISSDAQNVLGGISIDLSVQFEETDFAYLSRMLHAWGIPLAVDDRADKVIIGTPKIKATGEFPAMTWHWQSIAMEGALVLNDGTSRAAGKDAVGIAKQYSSQFDQQLKRDGANYLPRMDDDHLEEREWIAERTCESIYATDPAVYRLHWDGAVFDYSPGTAVEFGDQDYLVRSTLIQGDAQTHAVSQDFVLQDYMAPLQPHRRRVNWPSRILWACVTRNNDEDPTKQGRVLVEFDCGKLDPTGGNPCCWLPTLTPYGGLKGKSGTSGLLALPEVGERVLVQFLGDWDSDAVVLGSVREFSRDGFVYDPQETKRLQTPSGNQITLTSRADGSEIVRLKVQDKMVLEGKIASGAQTVILDLFDSGDDRIQIEKGGGPTRVDIFCSAEIYIHAEDKLLLEGGTVELRSTAGPVHIASGSDNLLIEGGSVGVKATAGALAVNSSAQLGVSGGTVQVQATSGPLQLDGTPMVMINCGPSPVQPPQVQAMNLSPLQPPQDNPQEGAAAQPRKRAKPPKWTAMVTTGQKTWIEIELKDDDGNPVPNERYRIRLADGSTREGHLDANGRARVDGIEPGTAQVSFPDIDANEWRSA